MNKQFDVLAFGSLTLDTFVALDEMEIEKHKREDLLTIPVGAKISMHTKSKHAGGSAANITTGLAKLGFHVGIYGTVGDDQSGRVIRHLLENKHVDTTGILVQKNTPSSSSIIIMTSDGQRTVLHERSTYAHFENFPAGIPDTRALYIGHLEKREDPLFQHLSEWKKKKPDGLIIWNPGKTQFSRGFDAFLSVFPEVDCLILNKEELELFAGEQGEIKLLVQKFLSAEVKSLIVTDGKNGAYYFSHEQELHQPITDINPPICSLGAGDAFAVGVVASLLGGKSAETQLLWGTKSSESVIREFGAQVGQITREEFEA